MTPFDQPLPKVLEESDISTPIGKQILMSPGLLPAEVCLGKEPSVKVQRGTADPVSGIHVRYHQTSLVCSGV